MKYLTNLIAKASPDSDFLKETQAALEIGTSILLPKELMNRSCLFTNSEPHFHIIYIISQLT